MHVLAPITAGITCPYAPQKSEHLSIYTLRGVRKAKDRAAADLVRDRLGAAGVVLEDRPDGTGWSRK